MLVFLYFKKQKNTLIYHGQNYYSLILTFLKLFFFLLEWLAANSLLCKESWDTLGHNGRHISQVYLKGPSNLASLFGAMISAQV